MQFRQKIGYMALGGLLLAAPSLMVLNGCTTPKTVGHAIPSVDRSVRDDLFLPGPMLAKAERLLAGENFDAARTAYEDVIRLYPYATEADRARSRITEIEGRIKELEDLESTYQLLRSDWFELSSLASGELAVSYTTVLMEVERPADTTERYGTYTVETPVGGAWSNVYTDRLVTVYWLVAPQQLQFELQNNTDHSVRVIWDEAAYVDGSGASHGVMHAGVRYVDRRAPQLPTVVARRSRVAEVMLPSDNISWSEAVGDWDVANLLPEATPHPLDVEPRDPPWPRAESPDDVVAIRSEIMSWADTLLARLNSRERDVQQMVGTILRDYLNQWSEP